MICLPILRDNNAVQTWLVGWHSTYTLLFSAVNYVQWGEKINHLIKSSTPINHLPNGIMSTADGFIHLACCPICDDKWLTSSSLIIKDATHRNVLVSVGVTVNREVPVQQSYDFQICCLNIFSLCLEGFQNSQKYFVQNVDKCSHYIIDRPGYS